MSYLSRLLRATAMQAPEAQAALGKNRLADLRARESEIKFQNFDAEAGRIEDTLTRLRDQGALID